MAVRALRAPRRVVQAARLRGRSSLSRRHRLSLALVGRDYFRVESSTLLFLDYFADDFEYLIVSDLEIERRLVRFYLLLFVLKTAGSPRDPTRTMGLSDLFVSTVPIVVRGSTALSPLSAQGSQPLSSTLRAG